MRTRKMAAFGWSVVPVAAVLLCQCSSNFTTADAGTDAKSTSDAGTHEDAKKDSAKPETDSGKPKSDGGGGSACATYASDFCNYLSACEPGKLATDFGTLANCESVQTGTCTNNLSAHGSGVTSSWLTACGASYTSETSACKNGPALPAVPTPTDPCAIVGTGAAGAACGIDAQCATDECNRVGTLCGQCTTPGAVGTACGAGTGVTCARGLACSAANDTCITVEAPLGTCDFGATSSCQAGSECIAGDASATTGTCVTSGTKVGAACNAKGGPNPDCSALAGLFCDTTTNLCASITHGAAASTCGANDGGTADTDCLDGVCVAGKCVTLGAPGASCTVGIAGCQVGDCVAGDGGLTGTCSKVDLTCSATDGGTPDFSFSPSNVSLADIFAQAAFAQVESITSDCQLETDPTHSDNDCFNSPVVTVTQPDMSQVNLLVVKSLSVSTQGYISVSGSLPLVIVSLSDINFMAGSSLQANGAGEGGGTPGANVGPGGGAGGNAGAGIGIGAGLSGSSTAVVAGGGASYCGVGGAGGGGTASTSYGKPDIRPLVGGSGGGGGSTGDGGNGGGAVQLVAAGTINFAASSYITVSGGGGGYGNSCSSDENAGGGGSGGSILLEAPSVSVAGILVANGGGGGGGLDSTNSQDGWDNTDVGTPVSTPAAGGAATPTGAGGAGSAGPTVAGGAGGVGTPCTGGNGAGGGGGGAGRIRINSATKAAALTGTVSPDTTTVCLTQGDLRSLTAGP